MLRRLKAFATFSVFALLTLGVLEVFLRGAEIQLPGVTRYDEVLGLALKGDRRLVRFEEGFYLGGTNSFGYFGKARPHEKPSNTVRIALIGDSQVEGHQLFLRDHFGTVLETELNGRARSTIEVLNFGMSGLNLSDAYCYFTDFAATFSPDFTLFVIGPGDLDGSPRRQERPYCYVDGDSLKINYGFARSPAFQSKLRSAFLRGESSVLSLVSHSREVAAKGLGPEIVFDKFYPGKAEPSLDVKSVSPSETTLRIVRELSQRKDVYFVLTESMPEEVVEEFKASYERVIDVRDCLGSVEGNPRYWVATDKVGHWNHRAHRAVGQHIAGVLWPSIEDMTYHSAK